MSDPSIFGLGPGAGQGDPAMSAGGSASVSQAAAGNARKKRMIDQIMQQRMGSQGSMQAMMAGGPEYLDYLQQKQTDPMNTFY